MVRFFGLSVAALTLACALSSSAIAREIKVEFSETFQARLVEEDGFVEPIDTRRDIGRRARATRELSYGIEEADSLRDYITKRVDEAMTRRGIPADSFQFNVLLVDAIPNRLTKAQFRRDYLLDFGLTRAFGGAELTGQVVDASGKVVANVRTRQWPSPTDSLLGASATWGDAHIAIDSFAEKMAKAAAKVK